MYLTKLMEYKELIAPYVTDTFEYLYEAVKAGKNILLEVNWVL